MQVSQPSLGSLFLLDLPFSLCVQDQYRFQNSNLYSVDSETLVAPPPPPRTQWFHFCMVSLLSKKIRGLAYYYLQNGISIYCSATYLLKNASPPPLEMLLCWCILTCHVLLNDKIACLHSGRDLMALLAMDSLSVRIRHCVVRNPVVS